MANDRPSSPEPEHRVVQFRRGGSGAHPVSTVEDLGKFERDGEVDDYRHRMMMNTAAFLFVVALISAGLWLANTMATMRRNQDCVLAGHRNCTPVEVSRERP
jgi:hypothetical protein